MKNSVLGFVAVTVLTMQVMAADTVTSVQWTEDGAKKVVTLADVKASAAPLFGYVRDLTLKQNLCYEGKDYEAVDLVYAGLNHRGTEICDSYFVVTGNGTLVVGPCQQESVSPDFYSAQLPVCGTAAPAPLEPITTPAP